MIYHKGKSIEHIFFKSRVVTQVWYMAKMVWTSIRSCFGTGIWKSEAPWLGEDEWKNHD